MLPAPPAVKFPSAARLQLRARRLSVFYLSHLNEELPVRAAAPSPSGVWVTASSSATIFKHGQGHC
jgi:hypothetical protein